MNEEEVRQELTLNQNNSYSDEARLKEAELSHDLGLKQLQFEKMKYENARPKTEKELELEYAYKNRVLDRQIADDQYRRSMPYKVERGGLIGAGLVAFYGILRMVFRRYS